MRLEMIRWDAIAAPDAADLRRRLERDGFAAIVWTDAPGAHYAAHTHRHDEVIWIVDGEIDFTAAGARFDLRGGDRLMLPAGTSHTADAGPRGATYLIGERRD